MYEKPIIVALDGMDLNEALDAAARLKDEIWGVKLNDLMDDDTLCRLIEKFRDRGVRVMGDPKVKDIPDTVSRRVKRFVSAGVNLLTVMADNTEEALFAATDATIGARTDCHIVGPTVLTSFDEEECQLTYGCSSKAAVLKFARLLVLTNVKHLVCSPLELAIVKKKRTTKSLICITPGIRLAGQSADDQKRIDTPSNAIKAGADLLVVGRAILKPAGGISMVEAAQRINAEVQEARKELKG